MPVKLSERLSEVPAVCIRGSDGQRKWYAMTKMGKLYDASDVAGTPDWEHARECHGDSDIAFAVRNLLLWID